MVINNDLFFEFLYSTCLYRIFYQRFFLNKIFMIFDENIYITSRKAVINGKNE